MELTKLEVAKRDATGTNAVRALRKQGRVPGVLYGHKEAVISFSTDERALEDILDQHAQFVEVDLDGSAETAIIRDVQYDTWGQKVLHVDFVRVDANEAIEVPVGISYFGIPKGVNEGGVLNQQMNEVHIRCVPRLIPAQIEINVKSLGVGDMIYAKDIPIPEGAELMDDPERVCCAVESQKVDVDEVAEAEDGEAEPEVIGEKPDDPES